MPNDDSIPSTDAAPERATPPLSTPAQMLPTSMLGRIEQTFPTLTTAEIGRLRRFGTLQRFGDGDPLFEAGKAAPGMFVVLSGHVAVSQRDGMGHVTPIVERGPGQFIAEVGQLSNRAALVDATAEGAVEALLVPADQLRMLLIAEAELGERIVRALILRRVALIQAGVGGPVLIGPAEDVGMLRLRSFLGRNGYPHHLLDPSTDIEAAEIIARYAPTTADLPLVIAFDGSVMRNPSEALLARSLGMVQLAGSKPLYDVAVVGAGPAGLATAVYAASEGLSVIVFDTRAFGGQAGASARIENYLGFPTGISGQALAGRANVQAMKFGAEMMIPAETTALDCDRSSGAFTLAIDDAASVRARAVVIASGARYRRPDIDRLASFEGHGVWYWASPLEARLCAGSEVILVGGGNSAGQAAVFLSGHAAKVRMMVRGPGLAQTMSRYLIDRIAAASNIELMVQTEIVALDGTPEHGLQSVRWRDRPSGREDEAPIRNVFLFVGADPATGWLASCEVALDHHGFVVTGPATGSDHARLSPLETSIPGVFAVGDVRSGSVKRVGAGIGEGAQVVQALHAFLAELPVEALEVAKD